MIGLAIELISSRLFSIFDEFGINFRISSFDIFEGASVALVSLSLGVICVGTLGVETLIGVDNI